MTSLFCRKDRRKPSEELVQIPNVSGLHKISSKKLLAKDYYLHYWCFGCAQLLKKYLLFIDYTQHGHYITNKMVTMVGYLIIENHRWGQPTVCPGFCSHYSRLNFISH
jgi:hypothetical protein